MGRSNTARASNPAKLPFSSPQYVKCNPIVGVAPVIAVVAVILLALVKGESILFGAIVGIVAGFFALQTLSGNAKRRFREGNLCAAQVVSVAPYTVAVLTDL